MDGFEGRTNWPFTAEPLTQRPSQGFAEELSTARVEDSWSLRPTCAVRPTPSMETLLRRLYERIAVEQLPTWLHSRRVSLYSQLLAGALGFSAAERVQLERAALLHDIGKTALVTVDIEKKGTFDIDEFEVVKTLGAEILAPFVALHPLIPAVLYHHERWDGRGYPEGLKGDEIPFIARVVSVGDTFDAMTSDRPYRDSLSMEAAVEEIRSNASSQFDPMLAEAFLGEVSRVGLDTLRSSTKKWRLSAREPVFI